MEPAIVRRPLAALFATLCLASVCAAEPDRSEKALLREFLETSHREIIEEAPGLFDQKMREGASSDFAFFRAFPSVFYRNLRRHFDSGTLPPSPDIGLVGDIHADNVVLLEDGNRVVAQMNDFDDAGEGPAALDIVRLLISACLMGEEARCSARVGEAREAYRRSLELDFDAWVDSVAQEASVVRSRGKRRHWREKSAPRRIRDPGLAGRLARIAGLEYPQWEVSDRRGSGMGSIGVRRYLFTRQATGHAYELKELRASAIEYFTGEPLAADNVGRVGSAYAELRHVPAQARTVRADGVDWLIRRREGKERSLNLKEDASAARVLAGLVAQLHRAQVQDPGRLGSAVAWIEEDMIFDMIAELRRQRAALKALIEEDAWSAPRRAFVERTLDNGLRVILSESAGSGLVASAVFVRAGAMRETEGLSGAAHFIEHLLFNGTKSRTQKELYDEVDRLGAYNNAATRRDFAVFLFLAGKESIAKGLEIQSDMLFNSVLPAEKFEKERGVVIEEIAKTSDRAEYRAELAADGLLYAGTPYARAVLGTAGSIQGLSRERMRDYYRTYYVPSNMTLLAMGDFNTGEMLDAVRRTFGSVEESPAPPEPEPPPPLEDVRVAHGRLDAGKRNLIFRIPGPMPGDPDYPALELLGEVLGHGAGSRLARACARKPVLDAGNISAGTTFVGGRAFFDIQAVLGEDTDPDEAARRFAGELFRLTGEDVGPRELEAARVSKRVEEAGLRQQIHYYSFMRGPLLMHADAQQLNVLAQGYREATAADLRRAAQNWFEGPPVLAAAVGPGLESRSRETTAAALGFTQPAKRLPDEKPDADKTTTASSLPSKTREDVPPRKIILDNGLRLIVAADRSSDILAMHLMGVGRSYLEPPGKEGIADFLHRMLVRGAGGWDRAELGARLRAIGAEVKMVDNPDIPYDDYYSRPEFSYARLETLDDYHEEAFSLLGAMATRPLLELEDMEVVRKEMLSLIAQRDASPQGAMESAGEKSLYGSGHSGATPVLGTVESVSSITRADLEDFRARYFSPGNLVLAVVTGLPVEDVAQAARRSFVFPKGARARRWSPKEARPPVTGKADRSEMKLDKKQSRILFSSAFDFDREEEAALQVANVILSGRMAFALREQQGLAYSAGSSFSSWGTRGVVTASMGTRPENLEAAEKGMVEQFDALAVSDIDEDDMVRAVNSHIGRMRMRRVTRMGRAYCLSMDELRGEPLGAHEELLQKMRGVRAADVKRVVKKYFKSSHANRVIVR